MSCAWHEFVIFTFCFLLFVFFLCSSSAYVSMSVCRVVGRSSRYRYSHAYERTYIPLTFHACGWTHTAGTIAVRVYGRSLIVTLGQSNVWRDWTNCICRYAIRIMMRIRVRLVIALQLAYCTLTRPSLVAVQYSRCPRGMPIVGVMCQKEYSI